MRYSSISWIVLVFLLSAFPAFAQNKTDANTRQDSTIHILKKEISTLEKRLQKLEEKQSQSELQNLLNEAENTAAEKPKEKKTKVFRGGQRALQAINPEMSVTGDFLSHYIIEAPHYIGDENSGSNFRVLGLHFRSDLDPFSYTKIAVEVHPEGAELGEAYAVWTGQIPGVSLMVGKFRQQFGIINRWHAHSLDQIFFPLAIQELFGPEGLNQTGFSMEWTIPKILPTTERLTMQLTNGQNENLFSGSLYSKPSLLAHLSNYYDLTRNTYVELGLTGMVGENRVFDPLISPIENSNLSDGHKTMVGGLDLTLFWEPLNRAHYSNFLWRSELYYVKKDLPQQLQLRALGGYSYIQKKMSERWEVGLRGDWTQPFALENSGHSIYQIVPYVTWWQSHWMRLRFEYQYRNGTDMNAENRIWLQSTWAAGPHKHERY